MYRFLQVCFAPFAPVPGNVLYNITLEKIQIIGVDILHGLNWCLVVCATYLFVGWVHFNSSFQKSLYAF